MNAIIHSLNDAQSKDLVERYEALKAQIKMLEHESKKILDDLILKCKGEPTLIHGRKLALVTRKGNVDYARVLKEHLPNVDVEPYRKKASEYWQLR